MVCILLRNACLARSEAMKLLPGLCPLSLPISHFHHREKRQPHKHKCLSCLLGSSFPDVPPKAFLALPSRSFPAAPDVSGGFCVCALGGKDGIQDLERVNQHYTTRLHTAQLQLHVLLLYFSDQSLSVEPTSPGPSWALETQREP